MNNYQNKYFKYKNKYLNLKRQLGGMRLFESTPEKSVDTIVSARFNYGSPVSSQPITRFNLGFTDDNVNESPASSIHLQSTTLNSPMKLYSHLPSEYHNIAELSTTDNEIIRLLIEYYGNDWIITGSVAVKLYLIYLNLNHLITFPTNDIDALIIKDSKLCNVDERRIGNYIRIQETPQRSVTFKFNDTSFDVNCVKRMPNKNIIFGINVLSPTILLEYYLDDPREKDTPKIHALHEIIKEINKNSNHRLVL